MIDAFLDAANQAGTKLRLVDLSADFRFAAPEEYERIYEQAHGAPRRLPEFLCALPEHSNEPVEGHVAHPGCFTTSVVLPCSGRPRRITLP